MTIHDQNQPTSVSCEELLTRFRCAALQGAMGFPLSGEVAARFAESAAQAMLAIAWREPTKEAEENGRRATRDELLNRFRVAALQGVASEHLQVASVDEEIPLRARLAERYAQAMLAVAWSEPRMPHAPIVPPTTT